MPITMSARKKVRQDKRRRIINLRVLNELKEVLKKTRKNPSPGNLQAAFSIIDQAAKKQIIHQNKAARLKSRLAKKIITKKSEKPVKSKKKATK